MSRVYFHSPSGTAELNGSELHHLRRVAEGPSEAAWNLDGHGSLERAAYILDMATERTTRHDTATYLKADLRKAQEADRTGAGVFDAVTRFVNALKTVLRVEGLDLDVAGVRLRTANVDLNTALVAGSDVVQLAAKIGHWAESHCWVEGSDRRWLADIIDRGLDAGIFRRGFWFPSAPSGPKDKWSDQGWDQVLELLRARDDEPVVLSYSVENSFPNAEIADWEPTIDPDWRPDWADDEGLAEWRAMSEEDRGHQAREAAMDDWYDLPDAEKWDRAMVGLRCERPWARLAPDTLGEMYFHLPVTVYDLLAPDRDERVRAAANLAEV